MRVCEYGWLAQKVRLRPENDWVCVNRCRKHRRWVLGGPYGIQPVAVCLSTHRSNSMHRLERSPPCEMSTQQLSGRPCTAAYNRALFPLRSCMTCTTPWHMGTTVKIRSQHLYLGQLKDARQCSERSKRNLVYVTRAGTTVYACT